MRGTLFFLLILSFLSVTAQNTKLYHKVLTKEDGLAFDVISAMAFDDDGFLWLGGLDYDLRAIVGNKEASKIQRFDGQHFYSFDVPSTKRKLNLDGIFQIVNRADGHLYVLGTNIFSIFNPKTQEFRNLEELPEHFSKIYRHQGTDYILTQIDREITLNILNEDMTFVPIFSFTSTENRIAVDAVSKIIFHKKGVLISDDNFPLLFFDWKGTLLKRYANKKYKSKKTGEPENFMVDEVFYRDNKIYVFMLNDQELKEVDFDSLEIRLVNAPNTFLNESTIYSYQNNNGHIVLHTSGQDLMLNRFTENGFTTTTARGVFDSPVGVRCASQDLNKELWVGTSGGELHYFKFPSKKIEVYLPDFQMRAIVPLEKDNYMICTERNGWFVFNELSREIEPYNIIIGENKNATRSTRNIVIDKDYMWFQGSGFYKMNKKTRETAFSRHYPVLCFEPLSKDKIVYGTNGAGLLSFDKRTMAHEVLVASDTLQIYDLAIHDSVILGATNKGVLHYNTLTKEAVMYDNEEDIGDAYVLMMDYQEPHGFILGSREGIISTFNTTTNKFAKVYEDELGAGIAKIVYDGPNWWISTFNGLVHYNVATKNVHRYSTKDGLSNNEGNRYSGFKTKRGILIGSLEGLNYFKPKDLVPDVINSELKLLLCKKFDKASKTLKEEYNLERLAANAKIVLPAEHKELELSFALTNNVTQNENSYQYRLNENDWVELGKQQTIRFPSLGAGDYELEIKALDFTGNNIGESLVLSIDSKQFFYKTWWFYLTLSLAAVSLLLFLLYQANIRQKMQRRFSRDLMVSQEKERNRIAKELHDSVGQQLTLIKRKSQIKEQAEITKLTNTVLEEVRSISRGLYPANLSILGLTQSIEQMVYEIDEQTSLFCSHELNNVDACFDEEATLNIFRFIQEALTNILKHANAKEVFVTLRRMDHEVVVEIEDNGKGFVFQEKQLNQSLGLKTLAERIKLLKGTLTIDSAVDKGTKLIAQIPIKA